MKESCIVISLFVLVGCTASRQSTPHNAEDAKPPLTAEQATSLAMRLAADKARAQLGLYMPFPKQSAVFVAGHWVWHSELVGSRRFEATVELAPDGSTNRVSVVYHGGLP